MKLNTIFEWCNDVDQVREFYSTLIGLDESFYDGTKGWLTYKVGETQLVFMRSAESLPTESRWAVTPAFSGGEAFTESWVIEVSPKHFDEVVARLEESSVASSRASNPQQPGRTFFVRDPMGKTVEIYAEEPTSGS